MAHVSNEEYLERWEKSAPTPVVTEMTQEQILATQGTRLNQEDAPWETYSRQLENDDPALLEAIAEYAGRVSDAEASSETKEAYAERKEYNDHTAQEYQWVSPEEYADAGARIGRVMHSSTFINLLRKAGVKCWYRQHPQAGKVTLVVQRGDMAAEVGCWVQAGFMPELGVMRFDDHGIPTTEKFRGWRTCLLQLILKSVITEKKAEEIFGAPATTPAFHRYNATLRSFRNAGGRLEN